MDSNACTSCREPSGPSITGGVLPWQYLVSDTPPGLQVAEAELVPALAHARLVLGGRPHGGREALVAPLRPPRELPRARAVEEDTIPQAGAEPAHVAVL